MAHASARLPFVAILIDPDHVLFIVLHILDQNGYDRGDIFISLCEVGPMEPESAVLEYKREHTEDIKKTIVAFANGDGGTLLIGVADDGTVVSTLDPDDVMLRTTNAARDAIGPDVTLFMSCEVRTIDDERVVAIKVQRGTARPYHLTSKGIRPEGVFVRQGPSTVPASESAILKMIRETSGDDYEATRSLRQGLTFESAGKAFSAEGLPFAHEQMRTLGILGEDRAFTGLGLLLSDQCPHTMKLAVFQGIDKIVFKDRHESSGFCSDSSTMPSRTSSASIGPGRRSAASGAWMPRTIPPRPCARRSSTRSSTATIPTATAR